MEKNKKPEMLNAPEQVEATTQQAEDAAQLSAQRNHYNLCVIFWENPESHDRIYGRAQHLQGAPDHHAPEKFLDKDDFDEIGKEIRMTRLGQMMIEEGIQEGENRLNQLNLILIQANRMDDVIKAANDKDYRYQLYNEFHLIDTDVIPV